MLIVQCNIFIIYDTPSVDNLTLINSYRNVLSMPLVNREQLTWSREQLIWCREQLEQNGAEHHYIITWTQDDRSMQVHVWLQWPSFSIISLLPGYIYDTSYSQSATYHEVDLTVPLLKLQWYTAAARPRRQLKVGICHYLHIAAMLPWPLTIEKWIELYSWISLCESKLLLVERLID